jgi:hypothetical protein
VGFLAVCGLLEEANEVVGHAAKIALAVRGYNAKQALASLLGQVGLLENALGRVDVGQIQGSARVTRVEDSCQPDAGLQWHDHDAVHLVVGDVAGLSEVDGVDDFVVTIGLVAVEVLRLPTVACGSILVSQPVQERIVGPAVC